MASIDHPRGSPRVRWTEPDGTPRNRTCKTERAARELLRAVQLAEDTGRKWEPESTPEIPTLRGIAAAWITACHRRLAPRTVTGLGQQADGFLDWYESKYGATAGPAHLSRLTVEQFWDHVRSPKTGRYVHRRSETTARKHIEAVHLLWAWAYDREEFEPHVPRVRRMELPRKGATTPRNAPTWAEMDSAITASDGWRRCVLIVMRCTGLRVQQVMGLLWDDLNEKRGMLTIRGELGKPNTERTGRVIPVAPVLLAEWRASRLADWDDPDWIVPCPHNHRLVRSRDIALIWKRAGVPLASWKGRPDHAFRAGFQTELAAAGVDRAAREYLVGHAQPGQDASYIEANRGLRLGDVVAQVPAMNVPALIREDSE